MRGVSKLLFNFAEDFLMALSAYHQASLKYSCYTLLFSIVQKQMKQLMINEKNFNYSAAILGLFPTR